MSEMSKDEKSLLLYFETAAVDYGGKIQSARMNADDFSIAKRWKESGFVQFGRIALDDIKSRGETGEFPRDHWVILSDKAWNAAHEERKARCSRIMEEMKATRLGLEATP